MYSNFLSTRGREHDEKQQLNSPCYCTCSFLFLRKCAKDASYEMKIVTKYDANINLSAAYVCPYSRRPKEGHPISEVPKGKAICQAVADC